MMSKAKASPDPSEGRGDKLANTLLRCWGRIKVPLFSCVRIGTPPLSGRLGGASPLLSEGLGEAVGFWASSIIANANGSNPCSRAI